MFILDLLGVIFAVYLGVTVRSKGWSFFWYVVALINALLFWHDLLAVIQ